MELPAGLVAPRYGDGALTELLPSVAVALGLAPSGSSVSSVGPGFLSYGKKQTDEPSDGLSYGKNLGLAPARCYVVALIDGLGWNLLRRHREHAPFLGSLLDAGQRLTCGVPSTTATSLTGLGTGLTPGQHGVVGYKTAVPGRHPMLLDALDWDDSIPPEQWQPYSTVFERLVSAGIPVTTVSRDVLAKTGLTRAGLRGGAYAGANTMGVRIERIVRVAREHGGLVYTYDGDLDSTGHRAGCESRAYLHQLASMDMWLARLRDELPSDAVLVVTGDHGMVDVPPGAWIDIDSSPDLSADVRVVAGDPRLRYLHTDAPSDVAGRWRDRLGSSAAVLTRDEAIDAGWFGEVEDRVRPRFGDVVVAAVEPIAIACTKRFPDENRLIGWHGSLTADEMLVPLLTA